VSIHLTAGALLLAHCLEQNRAHRTLPANVDGVTAAHHRRFATHWQASLKKNDLKRTKIGKRGNIVG
jgi:hypothetical protein